MVGGKARQKQCSSRRIMFGNIKYALEEHNTMGIGGVDNILLHLM
jgi:hypothetical protein